MYTKQQLKKGFKVAIFGLALTLALDYLVASTWQPPTGAPQAFNSAGPLHEGLQNQTKVGSLEVKGLTSDGGIFAPTVDVPTTLPADVLLWVGGVVRADDFCLNTNVSSCLSANPKKIVFSGSSILPLFVTDLDQPVYLQNCHPTNGNCNPNSFVPPGMPIPFDMTIKNLRFEVTPRMEGNATDSEIVFVTHACNLGVMSNLVTETALKCRIPSGGRTCSNTTDSVRLTHGTCLGIRIKLIDLIIDWGDISSAQWSFEGDY